MTKLSLPTLPLHNAGSIASSCAGVAVSLVLSGGMLLIMR